MDGQIIQDDIVAPRAPEMCEAEHSRLGKPIARHRDKVGHFAGWITSDVVGNITDFTGVKLKARVGDKSLAGQSCEVNDVGSDWIGVVGQAAPPFMKKIEIGRG